MAIYAQFFIPVLTTGQPIEGCGDRAIIRLDGRQNQITHERIAEQECRKRGFISWQLIKGPSLLRARPYTKVTPLFY